MIKKHIKTIFLCALTVFIFTLLFVIMTINIKANSKYTVTVPISYETTIKTGKYFVDGDTEQYYLDVTEDTIQLCNVDYLEYAWVGNELGDTKDDEYISKMTELAERRAEEYASAYKYKVITTEYPNTENKSVSDSYYKRTIIYTDWSVDYAGRYSGTGYILEDENTIMAGNSIFIYYDEELGDTVYKTETPTRVVDSLSYKEKMNNAKDDYSGYKKISSDVCGYEINVCFPEEWNEYLVTTDTQFMGIQLFNGEVPEQLEIIDGNIYIAVATHGFADRYVYDAGYDKCEKENFTTKNGYGLIIYYDKNGMPIFATFDDYKYMCIFFDVETKEEIAEIVSIVNSIEIS